METKHIVLPPLPDFEAEEKRVRQNRFWTFIGNVCMGMGLLLLGIALLVITPDDQVSSSENFPCEIHGC